MIDEVGRDVHGPRDVPSQLTGEPAHMRVPTGSGDHHRFHASQLDLVIFARPKWVW